MVLIKYFIFEKLSDKEKEECIKNINKKYNLKVESMKNSFEYEKFKLTSEQTENKNNITLILGLASIIFSLRSFNVHISIFILTFSLLVGFLLWIVIEKITNLKEISHHRKSYDKKSNELLKYSCLCDYIEEIFFLEKLLKSKKLDDIEKKNIKEELDKFIFKYDTTLSQNF